MSTQAANVPDEVGHCALILIDSQLRDAVLSRVAAICDAGFEDVATHDVAAWALEKRRTRLAHGMDAADDVNSVPSQILALLYAAERDVIADRRRRAVAIDAGRPHHELLMGWRDLEKSRAKKQQFRTVDSHVELFTPGKSVQLTLSIDREDSIQEALVRTLRELRGWRSLRNWAALQRLLSVEGGREGWVRWTLDDHLRALGYSPSERRRRSTRDAVACDVETFTQLELAVYEAEGKLRERRPLVHVGSKFDRLSESRWVLDGMELQINPLLYSGVRSSDGRIGKNWYPAPIELAQVSHARHPNTLALGLLLPIRWRLALTEERDHIIISGEKVLRLAAIPVRPQRASCAWATLERSLLELKKIGGIGSWRWERGERTLAGRIRLDPAMWMLDRTIRGVHPEEPPRMVAVLTGTELCRWRKVRGWNQSAAAAELGVGVATIKRAEAAGYQAVGPTIRRALERQGLVPGRYQECGDLRGFGIKSVGTSAEGVSQSIDVT